METVTEPQRPLDQPPRVEALRFVVLPLVAVGRAGEQQDEVARRHGAAVELDVPSEGPPLELRGRVPTQRLLDRVRHESGVVEQELALIGKPVQGDRRVGHQLGDGLVARHCEQQAETDELLVGQVGVDEHADEVVGTGAEASAPLVHHTPDEGAELPARRKVRVGHGALIGLAVKDAVRQLAHGLAMLVGQTEQLADDVDGHARRQVAHDVGLAPRDEGLEAVTGEAAHECLELGDASRGERPAHELAETRVLGWVHREDHRPEDTLERGASGRAERGPVDRRVDHVVVARQGPEPELVVAPHRRLVPQPAVDRVRVVVDLVGERVVAHASARFDGRSCRSRVPRRYPGAASSPGDHTSVCPARSGGGPLAPAAPLLQRYRHLVLHRRSGVLREAGAAERLPRAELELIGTAARRPVVVARLLLPDAGPDATKGGRRLDGGG